MAVRKRKAELRALKQHFEQILTERLHLRLKPQATTLQRASHGLSFLGMRIFPGIIRVKRANRQRSLRRMRQTIRAWERGFCTEEHMSQSVASIAAHVRYFCPQMPLNDLSPERGLRRWRASRIV